MMGNDAEPFDFDADVFDSRDVIERIEYLSERLDHIDGEERAEWEDLVAFAAEAGDGSVPDWQYGATFIADSYFEDYARELAEDIGSYDPEAGWPLGYIDWERAADALRMDYTSFELRGRTYWARA